jgi:hypothetical protein
MMEEKLKNKLNDFEKSTKLMRGNNLDETEIGGGCTVQTSTTIRAVYKTSRDEGIKSVISDFFSDAEGGKIAKKSALDGCQKCIGGALNSLFDAGSGSLDKISKFVVVVCQS